jgi:hypothetical protein
MASTTVARTQPLVVQPVMSMVSIPCAVKIGAKGVPKNWRCILLNDAQIVILALHARVNLHAVAAACKLTKCWHFLTHSPPSACWTGSNSMEVKINGTACDDQRWRLAKAQAIR